jgi:hypothetical protein
MTEQPPNQDDDEVFLSPAERYSIFNEIYGSRFNLNPEDNLFEKTFNELESENTIYRIYFFKLKDLEEKLKHDRLEAAFKLKEASEKLKRAEEESKRAEEESRQQRLKAEEKLKRERLKSAEKKFFLKVGKGLFKKIILKQICNELGPLLFEFVKDNLTPAQKDDVIGVIRRVLGNDLENCNNSSSGIKSKYF